MRRGTLAAAVDRDIVSLYLVLSLLSSSEYRLSALCSGYGRSRFSRVVGLWSHVFHYWGEGSFVPAATWGVLCSFVGFALTASRSFVWVDNGTG